MQKSYTVVDGLSDSEWQVLERNVKIGKIPEEDESAEEVTRQCGCTVRSGVVTDRCEFHFIRDHCDELELSVPKQASTIAERLTYLYDQPSNEKLDKQICNLWDYMLLLCMMEKSKKDNQPPNY